MSTILLVDDLPTIRDQFSYDIERKSDHEVICAENGKQALQVLEETEIDVMILDLEMPVMDGLATLEEMGKRGIKDVMVLVYTSRGNFQSCVRAIQLGARNFFSKNDVKIDQLMVEVENAIEYRNLFVENRQLRKEAGKDTPIIGESARLKELLGQIKKVAAVPSNILITGESGTGKELVAREVHRLSPRNNKPFIAVNCAALPDNLVESELFGFEKGAFTGAVKTTRGKFEIANGGILFLDEIGEMPVGVQAKLLRVLQEGELSRLGGQGKMIKVDVRVLAATHQDLETKIEDGSFRQDLYYRICTHHIQVPPLRDRAADIGRLSLYFIERACSRFGIPPMKLRKETLALLKDYDWQKNNIRELENIIERMIIQSDSTELRPEHVPADIRPSSVITPSGVSKPFAEQREDAERSIILEALEYNEWHITNTARQLGIANHSNLLKIMRRLGIKRPGA